MSGQTAAIMTVTLGIMTKGRYYAKVEATDVPKEDYITYKE